MTYPRPANLLRSALASAAPLAMLATAPLQAQEAPQSDVRAANGRCVALRGFERTLGAFFSQAQAANGTPGISATVFDSNGLVASAAAGVRSINSGDAVSAGDKFGLASNTKHLLAVSLTQLVDRGELSYDSRIAELLPDLADAMHPAYRDATVRQLLTMTAGLRGFDGSDPGDAAAMIDALGGLSSDGRDARRQLSRFFLSSEPAYAPGAGQLYSNAGFVVLGTIYERLSGRLYEQGAVDSVFGRVGASAGFGVPTDFGAANPSLHIPLDDGTLLAIDDPSGIPPEALVRLPPALNPGGGMVASMPDFARVEQQLLRASMGLTQNLASGASLAGLFRPVGSMGFGGIETDELDGATVHMFNGNTAGGYAFSFLAPEAGVGVVFATNSGINPFAGLAESKAEALMMMHALADRARLGILDARTMDQAAVFRAVDSLCAEADGARSPISNAFIDLSAAEASALAERIAPDDSRLIDRLATAPLEAMIGQMDTHLSAGGTAFRGDAAAASSGWSGFASYGSLGGSLVPGSGASGTDMKGWASSWGAAGPIAHHLRAAIAIGVGKARATSAGGASARTTSAQMGLAIAYDAPSGWFGDARLVLAGQEIDTERRLGARRGDERVRGERFGFATVAEANLGVATGNRARIAPVVGLRFTRNAAEAVTERGSPLALAIDARSAHRLDVRAGLAAATSFTVAGAAIRPNVEAHYVRGIASSRPEWEARFAGTAPAMQFAAAPDDRDWTHVRGGVDVDAGGMAIRIGAEGDIGRHGRSDIQLTGGVRVRF